MSCIDLLFSRILCVVANLRYKSQAEGVLLQVRELIRDESSNGELENLVDALILAEDHRFNYHYGIDVRAIFRAALITFFAGRTQGASTITQQLTRVITGDYRRTFSRKFRELCLAAWVDSKVAKKDQAVAYLCIAYFGWRMSGWKQAITRLQINSPCSFPDAAAVVARLKYPEPRQPSPEQARRVRARQGHILKLQGA